MSEDVNNILNKALINADLNSMQNDLKQSNVPQDWRAKLDIGEDGGYFISTPRNANELPDAVELFKDFDLDPKAFEDSDEDSDKDEKEDNMEVGSSKVSSKQAYKAQKQLYDLTVATSKLGKQLESLSKPLKNGQKIIENLNKVGLGKFI